MTPGVCRPRQEDLLAAGLGEKSLTFKPSQTPKKEEMASELRAL